MVYNCVCPCKVCFVPLETAQRTDTCGVKSLVDLYVLSVLVRNVVLLTRRTDTCGVRLVVDVLCLSLQGMSVHVRSIVREQTLVE